MKITMAHGSGGTATSELIDSVFMKAYGNEVLAGKEDSAVLPLPERAGRIAMTTDSFVVTPLEYPGGDIGRLAVCGTVNDLLVSGAIPAYLSCAVIMEEGLETELLERVMDSMARTAEEAGVRIVCGDTKVIEGNGGLIINTAGIGFLPEGRQVGAGRIQPGDKVLISGTLGEHHGTILSCRLGIDNTLRSDNAPLGEMVEALFAEGIDIHEMRDITRGGLATVLSEIAEAGGCRIRLEEEALPVSSAVKDLSGLLGLDPLYMGNEGKLVFFIPEEQSERALEIVRSCRYGEGAVIAGTVLESGGGGELLLQTELGGRRRLRSLQGEGLPRIC